MYVSRHTVTIVTNADGDGTGYTSETLMGRILSVRYVKAGSGGYADGVDFTATLEATGQTIMVGTDVNASASFYPRVPTTDAAGADTATLDAVVAADDRVKIVVAAGGDTKTGTFHITCG